MDMETKATHRVERPPSHFVDGGMACSMSTYATVSVEADVARTSATVRSIDPIVYLMTFKLVETHKTMMMLMVRVAASLSLLHKTRTLVLGSGEYIEGGENAAQLVIKKKVMIININWHCSIMYARQ